MQKYNREFILANKKDESKDVVSLYFRPTDNQSYKFIPGQYVDIKLSSIYGRSKSYTISSSDSDNLTRLTIKRKGEVSSALIDLSVGDKLMFDGPYGNFYPKKGTNDIVMIAGGVGITPFYSVIKSKLETNSKVKIILIYSNKTKNDIIFFNELNKLATNNPKFKIVYCLTQEKTLDPLICEYTRINKKIINKYIVSLDNRCYYICGSIGFVNNIWKILKGVGVPEEQIYTESFY